MAYTAIQQERILNNQCFSCGDPQVVTKWNCNRCAEAARARARAYYQTHKEQRRESSVKWRKRNPERLKEYAARSGSKPERIDYMRAYREQYRENIAAYKRGWKEQNGLYARSVEPVSLFYPYSTGFNPQDEGAELLIAINNLVPRSLPEAIRADVCQEIALDVLLGNLNIANLAATVGHYIKSAYKFPLIRSRKFVSLDQNDLLRRRI